MVKCIAAVPNVTNMSSSSFDEFDKANKIKFPSKNRNPCEVIVVIDYISALTDLISVYEKADEIVSEMQIIINNSKALKKTIDIFADDKPSLFIKQTNMKAPVLPWLQELDKYYHESVGRMGKELHFLKASIADNDAVRELPTTLRYGIALKFILEDCKRRKVSVVEAAIEYEKRINEIRNENNDRELIDAIEKEIQVMSTRAQYL